MNVRRGRTAADRSRTQRLQSTLAPALIALAIGVAPHAAHAASGDAVEPASALKKLSLEQLFDLKVTSVSQKPESLSKAAAAVHVVTHDDIQRSGAPSIPEALRNIPGVEVARVDARQYAITARGFNGTVANKLLVLMDGRSVYTPLYSGVFWDVQDTFLEDVEQIEVIRGPGATVWGANAVNGVINVITKDASQTQGLLISGGGGDPERGFGGVRYGGTLGSHGFFRAYGKHFERDASLRPSGKGAGDNFRMSQGGFRADWTPCEADHFTLQGDGYGGTARQPTTAAADLQGGNALAQWTRRFTPKSDLQVRAYYDRTGRNQPPVFDETLDTYDLTVRHRFSAGDRQDVVWGVGYRLTRDDVRTGPFLAFLPARLVQPLWTCFVQDEIATSANRVHVTLGSKFEHNDYTGFEFEPSVRLAWTPEAPHSVWAAASRAIRAPSRIDRDFFAPATPPFLLAGNRDFESEVLYAYELGYKVRATSSLTASLATFYNSYNHLRSLELGTPALLANGVEGSGYGVEGEATWQAADGWRLNPGYTFLRLDLKTTAGSTDTTQVRQDGDSPRHQFFVRSSFTLPRGLDLDVTVRGVSELPHQGVPAYATADARLAWQATPAVEVSVAGQNLLHDRHPEFGTPASRHEVQRGVYGRVACQF